jgi:hypothetical protein
MEICTRAEPPYREVRPGHFVACYLHETAGQVSGLRVGDS